MSSRYFTTLALAACLAVTVLLWGPQPGSGRQPTEVDLTARVTVSNCIPCHAHIGETDVPGLRFSHSNHMLVKCDSCHVRAPHEAGFTYRVTMNVCFVCHGLQHGAQGLLAASECTDCHTPRHVLRPTSHAEDWAAAPHARVAAKFGVNKCILCHDAPIDCDACHAAAAPDVGPMPRVYLRNLPADQSRPAVLVDTRGEVMMSQCVFCHPTIDPGPTARLVFGHDPHLRRDYDCSVCHDAFPHRNGLSLKPVMLTCYQCHSLTHADKGEVAPENCEACHPPAFELTPPDHTAVFVVGAHKNTAPDRLIECTMCHIAAFCTECHAGGRKMADGRSSPAVIPVSHRAAEWKPDHGGEYLGQRGACATCHTRQSCIRCHTTEMPHPSEWLARHAAGNGYPKADCEVCHTDRTDCQDCHHSKVTSRELLKRNCVECHEEMRIEPATKIKNIALAEHAVHFGVQESVGRPYVCEDCHAGFFTIARVTQPSTKTQIHDLRLCYDCHGNVGIDRLQIAPYPGSELCRRCHTDLRL